jgi:hypothetical protein
MSGRGHFPQSSTGRWAALWRNRKAQGKGPRSVVPRKVCARLPAGVGNGDYGSTAAAESVAPTGSAWHRTLPMRDSVALPRSVPSVVGPGLGLR